MTTIDPAWWLTKDGDADCYAMFERHYSATNRNRKIRQFVGPGQNIVLRTLEADAMYVWQYQEYRRDGQFGINCAVFRNENPRRYLSSELVRQACRIADFCWPNQRNYTFVDASKVGSTNAGFCFLKAGWRRCGKTKSGLDILCWNCPLHGDLGDLG